MKYNFLLLLWLILLNGCYKSEKFKNQNLVTLEKQLDGMVRNHFESFKKIELPNNLRGGYFANCFLHIGFDTNSNKAQYSPKLILHLFGKPDFVRNQKNGLDIWAYRFNDENRSDFQLVFLTIKGGIVSYVDYNSYKNKSDFLNKTNQDWKEFSE